MSAPSATGSTGEAEPASPAVSALTTVIETSPGLSTVAITLVVTNVVTRGNETISGASASMVFGYDVQVPAVTLDAQPEGCSSRWLLYSRGTSTIITSGNYGGVVNSETIAPTYWQDCYPTGPSQLFLPTYSPTICTGAWTLNALKSGVDSYDPARPETIWTGFCCPSGMSYLGHCEGSFSTRFTALAPISISPFLTVWDTVIGSKTYRSETVLETGTLSADPMTILWRSKDLSQFPSAYATALATRMEISYGAQPSLATGAKVGIALGAVLGFLVLVGAILMYLRRRRHGRRRRGSQTAAEMSGRSREAGEMAGHSSGLRMMVRRTWRGEMDGMSQPLEKDSVRVYEAPVSPAELEAPLQLAKDSTLR